MGLLSCKVSNSSLLPHPHLLTPPSLTSLLPHLLTPSSLTSLLPHPPTPHSSLTNSLLPHPPTPPHSSLTNLTPPSSSLTSSLLPHQPHSSPAPLPPLTGSNGPRKFAIKRFGAPTSLPRAHTWSVGHHMPHHICHVTAWAVPTSRVTCDCVTV